MFKVSVKGVVAHGGEYLLRINERDEYELLGGKLERADKSLADRVRQELLEESGIVVEPAESLEPWFYVIGGRPVLIVPMRCAVVRVPERLFDQDGGRLEWVGPQRLGSIRLPASYAASLRGTRPGLLTLDVGTVPQYEDIDDWFDVELVVRDRGGKERYGLVDACDFGTELQDKGYGDAVFDRVEFGADKRVRVVYDASGAKGFAACAVEGTCRERGVGASARPARGSLMS